MDELSKGERRILLSCAVAVMVSLAFSHFYWGQISEASVMFQKRPARVAAALPKPEVQSTSVLHIWKIADLYAGFPNKLERRPRPEVLNISHVVKWDASKMSKPFAVQVSSQADFSGSRLQLQAVHGFLNVQKAFAGDNFWRVSAEHPRWSGAGHFFVRPEFLDEVVKAKLLSSHRGEAKIQWMAPPEIKGVILEISPRADFPQELTAVTHLAFSNEASRVTHHKFLQSGTYYLRSRGYNTWQQVSEYSIPVSVQIN